VILRENRFYLQTVGATALFIGLIVVLWIAFNDPTSRGDAEKSANSTRTALAMTERALLGPFPTATAPTATASKTPTNTFTPTHTTTPLPSRTPTPFLSATLRPKRPNEEIPDTSIPVQPTVRPASTRISNPPTNPPPADAPTQPPANPPTQPPANPPTQQPPPTDPPTQQPPPPIIDILPTIPPIETLFP